MGSLETSLLATVHGLGSSPVPGERSSQADEKTALKAFDTYFLGEMLRQSRPKNTNPLFDGGQAGRMYQDHLYQEFARLIAENGDFGLAGSLKGSLDRQVEEAPAAEPAPRQKSSELDRKEGS